ncbi:MAG: hypothetical protein AAFY76_05225 [Cyanobacteria bacterium J06649_11]
MVDPELDYYAYSYHDSYYNQPQDNGDVKQSKTARTGILEQFRRR